MPCLQAAANSLAVSALVIALMALVLSAVAVFFLFKRGDFGTPAHRLLTPTGGRAGAGGGYATVNET